VRRALQRDRCTAGVLALALSTLSLRAPAQTAQTHDNEPVPSPTPAQVTTPVATSKPPPPLVTDWVELTLVTDDPHVALYAKEPRKVAVGDNVVDGWSFVCQKPCGLRVDPRRAYRVMGESLTPSVEFNLAPGSGRVALDVHPRHPPLPAVTGVLATAGAVSALGGVLMLLLDLAEHGAADALGGSSPSAKDKLDKRADTYGDIGAGMLVGGALLGGAAIVYLLTAGKTELAPAASTTKKARADGNRPLRLGFSF
jgi:hypothetical protein